MKNSKALLVITVLLFFFSCKKTDSQTETKIEFWKKKRAEISANVTAQFLALKRTMPSSLTIKDDAVFFDNSSTNSILKSPSSNNKVIEIKLPNTSSEVIAFIKPNKSMSTPVGPDDPTGPTTDPAVALLAEGYRSMYWAQLENYTDLNTFVTNLDGIALGLVYDLYNSDEEKIQILNEIEWLKAYATSLENDPDYWINLYAPEPELSPISSTNTSGRLMSLKANQLMNSRTLHCKVDARKALMTGVVNGLRAGVVAGYTGATAGTVAVPVIGTVTGGVSGFMGGFAAGFLSGTISNVVIQLALTCFR